MVTGTPKFNGLTIATMTADFTNPTVKLECQAAFVSSSTGRTHGWSIGQSWSRETIQKLGELRDLMERDLAHLHFSDGDYTNPTTSATGVTAPGGIGEHLGVGPGGEDVPSV